MRRMASASFRGYSHMRAMYFTHIVRVFAGQLTTFKQHSNSIKMHLAMKG